MSTRFGRNRARRLLVMDHQTLHNLCDRQDPRLAAILLERLIGPWMRGEVR